MPVIDPERPIYADELVARMLPVDEALPLRKRLIALVVVVLALVLRALLTERGAALAK